MADFDYPYYDREGKRISQEEWIGHFSDKEYKQIAADEMGKGDKRLYVSTVWLGIDHGFSLGGAHDPVIFETMIFGMGESEYMWRYTSEADARLAHARIVSAIQNGLDLDELDPLM